MRENYNNLFVGKKMTIKNAMKQMDKTSKKILFVVDKKNRLLGAITDGDVRRWILSGGNLSKAVENIYNRKPIYIKKDIKNISKKEIQRIVLKADIESFPVVDDDMKIVDILFWQDIIKDDAKINKKQADLKLPVVIMAGGQGSRLDPFTRILPKALLPVGNKPAVEMIIDNFSQFTSGDIYLILGYKAEMIRSYFDNHPIRYRVKYIYEGKDPLGTAGGLKLIGNNFSDAFFLSNCDTMVKTRYDKIYDFHRENQYDLTIIGSMQHFMLPYGIMKINSGGHLNQLEEKPKYDFLVNTGMYLIEKKVLKYIPPKKKFHITDLIRKVQSKKAKVGVYPVSEKSWFDMGQWESYRKTNKHLIDSLKSE